MENWTALAQQLEIQHGIRLLENSARSVSGGDIHRAYQVDSASGPLFIKTNTDRQLEQFQAELAGLRALGATECLRVPQALACGRAGPMAYLVLEWLDMSSPGRDDWQALGSALAELHRIVNLEQGRPLVETALRKMDNELRRAQAEKLRVLTLIHGYGSSGRGGRIRRECRKVLDHLVEQKQINSFIAGESFKKRTGAGKALLKRYGQLEQSCRSDFGNPGVTIVLL